MKTAAGYRATRQGNKLIVHDVPIFAECYRAPKTDAEGNGPDFDGNFDKGWLLAAARKAMAAFEERGYKGPVHIRHHDQSPFGSGTEPRPAGTFRVTGVTTIPYEGKSRMAIMADLIITDPAAQYEVMEDRLPFRSVEILNVDAEPTIDSVALLDTEVPFLRLPNLELTHVEETDLQSADLSGQSPVPAGTFAADWSIDAVPGAGPVVACFSAGPSAAFLFRDEPMTTTTKKKAKASESFGEGVSDPLAFADDEKPKEKKGDGDGDGGGDDEAQGEQFDMGAIIKAVEDRSISVADMDALEAAIAKARQAALEDEMGDIQQLAPAEMPGAAMKANDPTAAKLLEQFSALKAEHLALKAQVSKNAEAGAKRTAELERERDVDAALKRLDGRVLGDLRGELMQFHEDFGAPAFQKHVDSLAKHNGLMPEDDSEDTVDAADANLSEEVMKFAAHGKEAVAAAAGYEKRYQWLIENRRDFKLTKEQFIDFGMSRTMNLTA